MVLLRVALWLLLAYGVLLVLAWRFQDRLAFPAPRSPAPDLARLGLPGAERVTASTPGGVRLTGLYLPPRHAADPSVASGAVPAGAAALLWFYGNAETVGTIWPVLRDFQPPGAALLALDYPGYGASDGRASEGGLYEAGELAYDLARARPEIDPERIFVYGRSLGTVVATHVAARQRVAGVILESPFTSARDMAGEHYRLIPRPLVRLRLDNIANVARIRAPMLVVHGTRDLIVPTEMGQRVAAAAPQAQLLLIEGAGHNDTYEVGGEQYRRSVWDFLERHR